MSICLIAFHEWKSSQFCLFFLGELTNALVDHLNVGVAQAYLNQKRLDAEAKRLHANATEFAKQTQNWISLVDSFNGSLKELGDVKSWASAIETDMKTVSSVLEYTYKVNKQATIQQQQPSTSAPSSVEKVKNLSGSDVKLCKIASLGF